MSSEPDLSWPPIAAFIRQLTHDVRNHLNGLELEVALLSDSVSDPQGIESVARLRQQLRNLAGDLRKLSTKFVEPIPTPAPITALELFFIFQEQAAALENLPEIDWSHTLQKECVHVDATGLAYVAKELFSNAGAFNPAGRLKVIARTGGDEVAYELHEPKKGPVETRRWGYSPFVSKRHGGYGLGLWEARRIVEANGGKITHEYSEKTRELSSTLTFPIQ